MQRKVSICFVLLFCLQHCFGTRVHQLNYTVPENEPAPLLIANLTADVLRSAILQTVLLGNETSAFLFSFRREQQPNKANLHLVVEDGLLLSKVPLDRETHGSLITLPVALYVRRRNATANERPMSLLALRVQLTVQDVNDNAPVWTEYQAAVAGEQSTATLQFSEAAQPGELLYLAAASDADADANALLTYRKSCTTVSANGSRLCASADPFLLEPLASGELAVRLNGSLDRESVSQYSFLLTASDAGRPRLSSTLLVRVFVTDVNEHAPLFSQQNYSVALSEAYAINQVFLQVHALDPDEGVGGQVTYSVRYCSVPDLLAIDLFTGELSLTRNLDYETAPSVEVRVQARDGHKPPKSSTAAVWISVLDVNDAAPFISFHDCGDPGSPALDIEEHRGPFVTGCRLSAVDDDAGPAGEVHCQVINAEASHFELEPASSPTARSPSYFLRLTRALDRELAWQHDVRVQCSDRGMPAQSSTARVQVRVVDINDCVPTFTPAHTNADKSETTRWFAEVRENSEPGTLVTRLTASDCDEGVNSQLQFEIVNQSLVAAVEPLSHPTFALNASTGELRLVRPLDRETQAAFLLQVRVRDNGRPSLASTSFLRVEVQDENDNPCVLSQRSYEWQVEENQVGVQIGQLMATDRDLGENGKFKFVLEDLASQPEPHRYKFQLDEHSGVLTNLVRLDREQQAVYRFTVRVLDRQRKFNDSAQLTVHVTDTNDNRPEFRFPSQGNFNVHVNYPLLSGDNVTRIHAVDPDAGENGTVYYSLLDHQQSTPRLFDVHPLTGAVHLKRDLETSDLKGHKLIVRAHDGGRSLQMNTATVYIYLDRGSLPSTLMRAEAGGHLQNAQSSTPQHYYFGGLSDALLLTVCLCAVFVCVLVLASAVLFVLLRRLRQQRKSRAAACSKRPRPKEPEMQSSVARCALGDPCTMLHNACLSQGDACCAGPKCQDARLLQCFAQTPDEHATSLRLSARATKPCVAVIDKCKSLLAAEADAEAETAAARECTPVWKPRTSERTCVNRECVLCRSVSKSATLHSPSSKRPVASSSSAATISRDYSVCKLLEPPTRRKAEESQRSDKDDKDSTSLSLSLSSGGAPPRYVPGNDARAEQDNREYVAAIAVHLGASQSLSPSKSRCSNLQSFNKSRNQEAASFV